MHFTQWEILNKLDLTTSTCYLQDTWQMADSRVPTFVITTIKQPFRQESYSV